MISRLDYDNIKFTVSKKDYVKIEKKNSICVNMFCYENGLLYPVHVSDKKSKYCLDLSLITDKNKSHYVYIKDFNRFMCNKTKNKNKNHFWRHCFQCFSSKRVLMEHKEFFLKVNGKGKQNIKLKDESIKFNSYFRQLAVPFKIYAEFESVLKGVQSNYRTIIASYATIISSTYFLQFCLQICGN